MAAASLEVVVKQLKDSGIIAPSKLENFIPPNAHPKDAAELARELVKSENLTPFQAQQVLHGKVKALFLGNYTILDKLGAGGMGQVFKAKHRRMDRLVAVKMLPAKTMKDAAVVARFEREVRAAAKLRHPNIVAADDADEANGIHFLVMEYVEGRDLSALVKTDGPFSVEKAIHCIVQAARGLEFAHTEGVVHRDIKPANLLLDKKGTVKILDMGLARIDANVGDAAHAELTGTGAIMGTVDYMAPEQGVSTKDADARADIYSLGCTLHFLLTGKPVYDGESVAAKLLAHHHQPIPDLCKLRSEVPLHVQQVFEKMVAKRREDRYQTMSEVIAALQGSGVDHGQSLFIQTFDATVDRDDFTFLRETPAAATKLKPQGVKKKTAAGKDSSRKLVYGGTAVAVLGVLILAGVIFKLQTKDGDAKSINAKVLPATNETAVLTTPNASSAKPLKHWKTPEFQKWLAETQKLPAEQKIEAVRTKLMDLNPGFDGKVTGAKGKAMPDIQNGAVVDLRFVVDNVTDISPLRAFNTLTVLDCKGSPNTNISRFSDLSPLEGMAITHLTFRNTQVSDLSPLKGMKLLSIRLEATPVSDCSPLEGMPLTTVQCGYTKIKDLAPFRGMPLANLTCDSTEVSDLSPLQECRSLTALNVVKTKVTPAGVAALQKALPNCKIEWEGASQPGQSKLAYLDPAFQQWVEQTKKLPAEKQIGAVADKLRQLNPGFDGGLFGRHGKGSPKIENGVVTEVGFSVDDVSDISPVRALAGLKAFHCYGGKDKRGRLTDLSPLRGMALTSFQCTRSQLSDLSPLTGMPLRELNLGGTLVTGLSPLTGLPLTTLSCADTLVSDLSPLEAMNLSSFFFTPADITRGISVVRRMPSLKLIGTSGSEQWPSVEFWIKYDAGEFGKPAATRLTELEEIDLLSKIDLARDAITGTWKKIGTTLIIPGNYAKLSLFTPKPLPDEYDVNLVVERKTKGGNGLVFGFVMQGHQAVVLMDSYVNPNLWAIEYIDGKRGDNNPTKNPGSRLPWNQPTAVRIGVRHGGVRVTAGNEQVIDWRGRADQLSNQYWKVADTQSLFLGSQNNFILHSLTLTPVAPGKELAYLDPAFQKWIADTQKLPAEKQIEAVGKKLMELNPGFDGRVMGGDDEARPVIKSSLVASFGFVTDHVTDISPLRALAGLRYLNCRGSGWRKGQLSDLSPLRGMALTKLMCGGTKVSDISPLAGMQLIYLNCGGTQVIDLSPLSGMPLGSLDCNGTSVSDLSPLMMLRKLHGLNLRQTKVAAQSVAALQRALPHCKIEWDDPAKATTPAPAPAGKK